MTSITDSKPTLHSYWRSSSSWRVRIALNFHSLAYTYHPINLLKNEQQDPNYKNKLNPTGMVPVLEIDGHVLTESLAIVEYLEETRGRKLFPQDAYGKSQVRRLALQIAAGIQPIQNLSVLKKIVADFGEEHKMPWGKHFIEKGFKELEMMLSQTAGKYSYGDEVTIADLCLVPQVYNANRFSVDMDQFPTIKRVHEACVALDEFKEAHPDQMPDAVTQ
uniref:Maleylacetoacetate isomerase n=1 Tax=Percolomonas cosmopolitus TaxID=63605 RepID=A0A7S1KTI1_9EUKA|eukprot:CAMPEP_0117448904 /NCGR_PEP_ID=MMETSP0759-20121206/7652_1 /TAXON_ID=63605 /ORGANISM="Percolomonas cosmopolitus, Strain WS" /LENGTH=218 /DNA_ID=CAMNT_0005241327 /DNA_START=13 /DNA_END=669 /DNA_ORIENTATION=-